jgi:hypothetical protein
LGIEWFNKWSNNLKDTAVDHRLRYPNVTSVDEKMNFALELAQGENVKQNLSESVKHMQEVATQRGAIERNIISADLRDWIAGQSSEGDNVTQDCSMKGCERRQGIDDRK